MNIVKKLTLLFCVNLVMISTSALAQLNQDSTSVGNISGQISIARVFGSDLEGIDAEEEDNGSAYVLRGSLDYDLDIGDAEIMLGYDTAGYFYDDDDRSNRWSNRGFVGASAKVSKDFLFFGQAAYSSNISSAESGSTDQTEVLARAQYTINNSNRVRAFGGYRWRKYDFDGSQGQGEFFGAELRHRIEANHYLTAEVRRESISSANIRRGYDRTTADFFYQRPIAKNLRLIAGATARWWEFDGRPLASGERLERKSFTPELDVQYATRPGVLLQARLQQILRGSNDPQFAENETRATVTLGYRF